MSTGPDNPLQAAEARFRALIEHSSDAIALTDAQGNVFYASPASTRLLGDYAGDVPLNPFGHIHPDDLDAARKTLAALLAHPERPQTLQLRARHQDGTWRWLEVTSTNMLDHPAVRAIVGNYRDISDRKEAEERLHSAEARFRYLVENSTDVVAMTDADGNGMYFSPSLEHVYGYPPGELVGTGMRLDLVHPDDYHVAASLFENAMGRPGQTVRGLYRFRHRDGSWRWTEATVTNLLDEPSVAAIVANLRDVTERIELLEGKRESEARYRILFEANPLPMWVYDLATLRFRAVNEAAVRHYGYAREEFLSMTLEDLRPAQDAGRPRDRRDEVHAGRAPSGSAGLWAHRKKDGLRIEVEPTLAKITYQGRPAMLVAVNDVTERERVQRVAEEQRTLSDALRETAEALSRTLEYDEVLDRILETVGRVVEYETADLMLLFEAEARIVRTRGFESFGVSHEQAASEVFPLAKFQNLREIYESGRPRVIADTRRWPSWVRLERYEWVRAYIGAPVRVKGTVIGFLNVSSNRPGFYQEAHGQTLQAFADQAAVALENSRLYGEVRRGRAALERLSRQLLEVQEKERRAIARELHDEIGQVLTGLKLNLEMAASRSSGPSDPSLQEAVSGVNELMDRVSGLMLDLRPSMLDDLGLLPALLAHLERYGAQTGVHVRFEHRGLDRRFPAELETAAYRIIQEALTNVARHAEVNEARVLAWADAAQLGLRVEDHGHGFEPLAALARPSRSGMMGMRERAVLLGGTFHVESRPGKGTALEAILPLQDRMERRAEIREG